MSVRSLHCNPLALFPSGLRKDLKGKVAVSSAEAISNMEPH